MFEVKEEARRRGIHRRPYTLSVKYKCCTKLADMLKMYYLTDKLRMTMLRVPGSSIVLKFALRPLDFSTYIRLYSFVVTLKHRMQTEPVHCNEKSTCAVRKRKCPLNTGDV